MFGAGENIHNIVTNLQNIFKMNNSILTNLLIEKYIDKFTKRKCKKTVVNNMSNVGTLPTI